MRDRLPTLAEIERAVWRELQRAPLDRHHAWRTPVLATADAQGLPDARTVVLREVDADDRRLSVYTDTRSAKVVQLVARPDALLVMWSAALGWQLRCRVQCTVHRSGLAVSSRWERVRQSPSAQDYLSPLPPGEVLPSESGPTDPDTQAARQRPVEHTAFGVVDARVEWIDWLELHRQGHRRARFEGDRAVWLQP